MGDNRIAQLIARGAERVLEAPTEMFERVDAASLAEHDPAVAADPLLLAALQRNNRASIVHWARCNVNDPGAAVPALVGPELLGLTRDLVRRGLDSRALEPFRAGQNAAWQLWMEIAFSLTDDPGELRDLLRVSARSIFAYVDATNASLIERVERDREELTRGTNAERLETATLVIDGAPIDTDRAAARLGYAFERRHLAAVIWSTSPAPEGLPGVAEALPAAAEALAAAAGAARALTVIAGSAALWAWVAVSGEPDPARLAEVIAGLPDVRVAIGRPASGIEGFRRSHHDALAAQRLVERLGAAERLVRYESIRPAALITADKRGAEAFARDTLGELADAPAVLRATLRAYLHRQSNATRTAAALFTHRNTVVSRIAKAESLLPRPLDACAFEVAVALEALHWAQ